MLLRRRRHETPLWLDVVFGAVAGALGTSAMNNVVGVIESLQPSSDTKHEHETEYDEDPTERVARKVAEPLGLELGDRETAGQVVHWAYGTLWGVGYALIARRFGTIPLLSGVVLGVGLWAIGDETLIPALRLGPKSREFPATTHLKTLGGHVAYGAGVDTVHRLLGSAARPWIH